jgi:hypothetical protein
LECNDVVRLPLSWNLKHKFGDKIIRGIIHEVLPRRAYRVLSHAGVLSRKIGRDELIFESTMTVDQLQLGPRVALLPPISEKNALSIISPNRQKNVVCKCHKVRRLLFSPQPRLPPLMTLFVLQSADVGSCNKAPLKCPCRIAGVMCTSR